MSDCQIKGLLAFGCHVSAILSPTMAQRTNPDVKFSTSALMPNKLDLSVDRGETLTLWQHRWEDFYQLSGLEDKDPVFRMAVLRSCFSDETLKIAMNLDLPDEHKNSPTEVIKALRVHAHGQINVVMERRNFNLRTQQPGEMFDDFLTSLKELAKTCDFCAVLEGRRERSLSRTTARLNSD